MKKFKEQKGSITLETTIVLPFFIFMFLMIFGLFSIVSAQNQISHALIQSSKSMSLDPYYYERVKSAGEDDTAFWGSLSDAILDLISLNDDKHFLSQTSWYKNDGDSTSVARDRFVGYLAGGDEKEAEAILKNLGVVDGLKGIKFTTAVHEDKTMTITIDYTLQYVLDAFDMGQIPMSQSVKVKLWGAKTVKAVTHTMYTTFDAREPDPKIYPGTSGHSDVLNTGLDPEALADNGYKNVQVTIDFDAKRLNAITLNNPTIEIYSGGKLVATLDFTENFGRTGFWGTTHWTDETATLSFPVDQLADNGEITIVWKCDKVMGSSSDGYEIGDTTFTVDVTK